MNLIQQSLVDSSVSIVLLLSTQPNVPLASFCEDTGVAVECLDLWCAQKAIRITEDHQIEVIVLAGFLRKITPEFLKAFPERILNLHPSLLPKYGGKGMYGIHVHRKVIENQEKESGITIHLVNEAYDEGQIVAQFVCLITPKDSPESLEQKIRQLETQHFPEVVFAYCKALKRC